MCDTIFTKMGSRSTKNLYNYVGFPHEFLEKWKSGGSECFVLLSFSWYSGASCRYFGPEWGPCPKTFHFVQVFIGVWEAKSCEIVCENHQHSLGFNWYFACGDNGKLDSKIPKFNWVYVGFPLLFRRIQEKWLQKYQ